MIVKKLLCTKHMLNHFLFLLEKKALRGIGKTNCGDST